MTKKSHLRTHANAAAPTLTEKIELAFTCRYCDPERPGSGNCIRNGYAPFDCEYCTSYEKIPENNGKEGQNP
jgi:hypothetical protein